MARAAAESKLMDNQNNVHSSHPLGAGTKQLPDSDSHGIPPQHELPQTTDKLGKILTALGRGSKGSAAPPQVPSSSLKTSENLIEHKPRTPPISDISSSAKSGRSSNSNPAVTPLSHIRAFMVL